MTKHTGDKRKLDTLYRRDMGMCWICLLLGKAPQYAFVERRDASRDHFIPQSEGGSSAYENLRLAHKSCNNRRGNRSMEELLQNGL